VIYEITMRYFFGRPFRGGYELTELAMSLIVAFGLPYTAIVRGHVSVDILSRWLDRPACAG
jgi:TRAP-type transport system small permease protein